MSKMMDQIAERLWLYRLATVEQQIEKYCAAEFIRNSLCGANAQGGGGFQPGNTCGKDGDEQTKTPKSKAKSAKLPVVKEYREYIREAVESEFEKDPEKINRTEYPNGSIGVTLTAGASKSDQERWFIANTDGLITFAEKVKERAEAGLEKELAKPAIKSNTHSVVVNLNNPTEVDDKYMSIGHINQRRRDKVIRRYKEDIQESNETIKKQTKLREQAQARLDNIRASEMPVGDSSSVLGALSQQDISDNQGYLDFLLGKTDTIKSYTDTARAIFARAWDESKHPRHGKGNSEGGRFSVAPSGPVDESPDNPFRPARGQQELPFSVAKPGQQPDTPRAENPLLDRLGENAQPQVRGPEVKPPAPAEPPKPDPEEERRKSLAEYHKLLKEKARTAIPNLKPSVIQNAIREVQELGDEHAEEMRHMYEGLAAGSRAVGDEVSKKKIQEIKDKLVMWKVIEEFGTDGLGQGNLPDTTDTDSDGDLGALMKKRNSTADVTMKVDLNNVSGNYDGKTSKYFSNLAWAPEGTTMLVEEESGDVSLTVRGDKMSMWRSLNEETGQIRNNSIFIGENSPYKGQGAEIFAQQVLHAQDNGYDVINTEAGRGKTMNGYYTWFALGYDADVSRLEDDLKYNVRTMFPDAKTVQDVFDAPGGRDWWLIHGKTVDDAEFDLTPGSRSMKVLTEAIRAKQKN